MGKKRGFTVIELIVVIALLGVVMALGYNIWINMQKSYREQERIAEAQGDARNAIHLMINKMKRADSLIGNTGTKNIALDTSDPTLGSVIVVSKSSTQGTKYYKANTGDKIIAEEYGGATPITTNLVSNVETFSVSISAGKIKISIKIKDAKDEITGEYVQRAGIEN